MKKYLIIFTFIILSVFFFILFPIGKREGKLPERLEGEKEDFQEEGGGEIKNYNMLGKALEPYPSYDLFPIRDYKIALPELGEKAGIAILFNQQGKGNILYQKNINEKLPVASLTKLMSAIIVIDKYPLDKEVTVSQRAVWTEGESGRLSPGEKITIKNLLYLSLLVSSNDAASALAEVIGENKFVDLMNKKVQEIGLKNTHFASPHGLDNKENFSTAEDLAFLTQYSILNYPSLWEILKIEEIDIVSYDHLERDILHHTRNTNKLLLEEGVIGGKTGYTEEAKDTMILAVKAPGKIQGNIVLVLLGVDNRIQRTKQLYDWVLKAWEWE